MQGLNRIVSAGGKEVEPVTYVTPDSSYDYNRGEIKKMGKKGKKREKNCRGLNRYFYSTYPSTL